MATADNITGWTCSTCLRPFEDEHVPVQRIGGDDADGGLSAQGQWRKCTSRVSFRGEGGPGQQTAPSVSMTDMPRRSRTHPPLRSVVVALTYVTINDQHYRI
jgi:hypothetical protein